MSAQDHSSTPVPSYAAEPIVYFEHELMPGRPMFRCTRLQSNLQVSTCKGMWQEANASAQSPERLMRCRACPLGAVHAGVENSSLSKLRGSGSCSRCHGTDKRLIGGNICVSCKNREYEWIKGKNAKGRRPITHPTLERRCVRYVVGGEVKVLTRVHSASMDELVVELLRDSAKRVVLGRGCPRSALKQRELA